MYSLFPFFFFSSLKQPLHFARNSVGPEFRKDLAESQLGGWGLKGLVSLQDGFSTQMPKCTPIRFLIAFRRNKHTFSKLRHC